MIEIETSPGIAVPLSRSICARTARATAMALLPGRLATDSVTAGSSAAVGPPPPRCRTGRTAWAPRQPSVTRATSRRYTGLASVDAHHRRGHVVGAGEERAGLDDDVAVVGRQRARDAAHADVLRIEGIDRGIDPMPRNPVRLGSGEQRPRSTRPVL